MCQYGEEMKGLVYNHLTYKEVFWENVILQLESYYKEEKLQQHQTGYINFNRCQHQSRLHVTNAQFNILGTIVQQRKTHVAHCSVLLYCLDLVSIKYSALLSLTILTISLYNYIALSRSLSYNNKRGNNEHVLCHNVHVLCLNVHAGNQMFTVGKQRVLPRQISQRAVSTVALVG